MSGRFREALEKEEPQEFPEVPVSPLLLDRVELVLQVVEVAAVDEPLPLEEPDEHEAVQEHRCVPAAVALVVDAGDEIEEGEVLILELGVELLRDLLDIEALAEAAGDVDDSGVARFEVGDFEEKRRDLLEEEVTGLAPQILVGAGALAPVLSVDPVPLAAGALAVDEDEEVLVMELRDLAMDGALRVGVGNRAVRRLDLENRDAAELSDRPGLVGRALDIDGRGRLSRGAGPAELLDEERPEGEIVEALSYPFEVQRYCGRGPPSMGL